MITDRQDQNESSQKAAAQPILAAKSLVKRFGSFTAVGGVDIEILEGEIHAVIGPNGAGKTTFFNLLTKFLAPTSGEIVFDGVNITHEQASKVAKRGLVRSFQISAIFPTFTVLENVRIPLQRYRGENLDFWRSSKVLQVFEERARALLEDVGLQGYEHVIAGELPYGRKRALELATTLALEPKLLLLDEPTAGMTHEDVDRIVELISRIRKGRSIILVEHNLKVVRGLADRITVLARGQVLAAGNYQTVSTHEAVIGAYLGESDE